MRILVCSDTHLGHSRKACEALWNEVYIQFERVLSIAVHRRVDAILHAGDFFDGVCVAEDISRVSRLFQHYLCGKQKSGVNWRKRVLVSPMMIPFVAIAGNHDGKAMSSLEVMKSFGYIESPCTEDYYEKGETKYTMYPFVIQAGKESVAVYGMDYMEQTEMCRLWNEGKVRVCQPIKKCTKTICLIHQDMSSRFSKPAFPREKMPFDYVIYGHEHEQVLYTDNKSIQPGSTCPLRIANEDVEGKSVIIMDIKEDSVHLERIPLPSPWVINEEISINRGNDKEKMEVEMEEAAVKALERDGHGMGRVTFVGTGDREEFPEVHKLSEKVNKRVRNCINKDVIRYRIVPKRDKEKKSTAPSKNESFMDIFGVELSHVKPRVIQGAAILSLLNGNLHRIDPKARRKCILQAVNDCVKKEIESCMSLGLI